MSISKYKSNNQRVSSKEDVFETADFVLSVFLLYSGINLIRVIPYPDDKNKNRKKFVFEKTDQLEVLMDHYIATDPTVKLKKFISAQKYIKRMIYDN